MHETTNQEEITDIAKGILLTSRVIIGLCRQNQSVMGIDDVSSVDLHICHVVKQRGAASLNEIAKRLKVSQAYASGAVEGLVARKLLVRERDSNNRRKCIISIAPDAAKRIESMEAEILFPICNLVKNIGKAKTKKWIELFRQVEEKIDSGQNCAASSKQALQPRQYSEGFHCSKTSKNPGHLDGHRSDAPDLRLSDATTD